VDQANFLYRSDSHLPLLDVVHDKIPIQQSYLSLTHARRRQSF